MGRERGYMSRAGPVWEEKGGDSGAGAKAMRSRGQGDEEVKQGGSAW